MAKVSEEAAAELPLNDERVAPKKVSRHVTIGLRHFNIQRDRLLEKRKAINEEIEALDKAILALE